MVSSAYSLPSLLGTKFKLGPGSESRIYGHNVFLLVPRVEPQSQICRGHFLLPSYAAAPMACFGCQWGFLILPCTQLCFTASVAGEAIVSFPRPAPVSGQAGCPLTDCPPLLRLQRRWYETDSEYYLLQFTLTVRCLFYTSFSLELCRQPVPAPAQPASSSFPWLLAYVFYYPVFHNGPILNFPEFFKQVESSGGRDEFCVGLPLLPRL